MSIALNLGGIAARRRIAADIEGSGRGDVAESALAGGARHDEFDAIVGGRFKQRFTGFIGIRVQIFDVNLDTASPANLTSL